MIKKYKDFIEFDEIIFVYHDGTQSEPQRINIDKYTEEIDK